MGHYTNKTRVGIISGYFNPIHQGHLDYIEATARLMDHVCVIVNNDEQVKLKGSTPLYDEHERLRIVNALQKVDYAMVSVDRDSSVAKSIRKMFKDLEPPKRYRSSDIQYYFLNSGDRKGASLSFKEELMCEKLGITSITLNLPKVNSSSEIKKKL